MFIVPRYIYLTDNHRVISIIPGEKHLVGGFFFAEVFACWYFKDVFFILRLGSTATHQQHLGDPTFWNRL